MQLSQPEEHLFSSLAGKSGVAVAVSGGSDSMALLRLVLDWRKLQIPQPTIVALTVDHGLRAASRDEAATVGKWCAALLIPHYILPWRGDKPKTGLQAKARIARYDLMANWCVSQAVPVLLTGHTADDQAETVAMRLRRTSSPQSLAGIWPEREWKGVQVLRPLLSCRREALRDYLTSINQPWIEDPSNVDLQFERVRVRQQLADQDISGLRQQASTSLALTLAQQATINQWMTAHGQIDNQGCVWLPRPAFETSSSGIKPGILRESIQRAGGSGAVAPDTLHKLSDWAHGRQNGRRTLGAALVMLRRDHILVVREAGRINRQPQIVPAEGQLLWDERFLVSAPAGSLVASGLVFNTGQRLNNVPFAVQLAMPHVKLADGRVILAEKNAGNGVSAIFCERKPK